MYQTVTISKLLSIENGKLVTNFTLIVQERHEIFHFSFQPLEAAFEGTSTRLFKSTNSIVQLMQIFL